MSSALVGMTEWNVTQVSGKRFSRGDLANVTASSVGERKPPYVTAVRGSRRTSNFLCFCSRRLQHLLHYWWGALERNRAEENELDSLCSFTLLYKWFLGKWGLFSPLTLPLFVCLLSDGTTCFHSFELVVLFSFWTVSRLGKIICFLPLSFASMQFGNKPNLNEFARLVFVCFIY